MIRKSHEPGRGHFHVYLEQEVDNPQEKTVSSMHVSPKEIQFPT